jgi:RsiG-like
MAFSPDDLERMLDDEYLEGMASLDLPAVRARRSECQSVEVALSYLRRLTQGRLDIVHAELERRRGGRPGDLSELVDSLPAILSGRARAGGPGRLPQLLAPDLDAGDELTAELDRIAGPDRLGALPDMDDSEVESLAGSLGELETRLSAERRALHERIDTLQAEIVGRYKRGEASVDNLLT